jgi:hypothetical protein
MLLSNCIIVLVSVLPSAIFAQLQDPEAKRIVPEDLSKLAWIVGDWEMREDGTTTVEHWESPRGTTMLGLSHAYDEKKTFSFEFLRIAVQDGKIAYFAQPGGGKVVPFFATKLTEEEVVFENSSHDYPQRIRYEKKPAGLTATISLIDGSGATKYAYARSAKAPADPFLPRVMLREIGRAVLGTDEIVVDEETPRPTPRLIKDLFVDRAGRILALDRTWRLLQAFDREGAEIARGHFDSSDGLEILSLWNPFADPGGGHVLVRIANGEYVRFDEHARRLGRDRPCGEIESVACVFQPGSPQRWAISESGEEIVDCGKGTDSLNRRPSIRMRPDGRPLDHVRTLLVAEDGTLVVDAGWPAVLCTYPPDGSAGRTRELPGSVRGRLASVGPEWIVLASGYEVFLVERAGDLYLRAEFDRLKTGTEALTWLGSPDGREIWRVDQYSRVCVRYALP